jgi:hypothetical protein
VGIYSLTALALLGLALAPRARRVEADLTRGQVCLGAPLGLGPARAWPLAEVRFTYGEFPAAVAGITACRASLSLPDGRDITLLETTREAADLPRVLARALEQARIERSGAPLAMVAPHLASARGLTSRDLALIAGLLALGPALLWWYLR